MKSRTGAALITVAIACLCALTASAQTKPDFSGAWKMNKEKSKFAGDGPDAILIKVDHKEPALTEDWSVSTPEGQRTFTAKYTTDGKETEQEVLGGRRAMTNATWDGDALVIKFKSGGGFFNRKITLSADGKTMMVVATQSRDGGNQIEETVVFEKQ